MKIFLIILLASLVNLTVTAQDTSKFTVEGWHYEFNETFVLLKMQCTDGDRYLVFMAPKVTNDVNVVLNYDYPIQRFDAGLLFPFYRGKYAQPKDGREIGQILNLDSSFALR